MNKCFSFTINISYPLVFRYHTSITLTSNKYETKGNFYIFMLHVSGNSYSNEVAATVEIIYTFRIPPQVREFFFGFQK